MSKTKAERELSKLRARLQDTFSERRLTDTGIVTEVVRDRITDASGQVLDGGKVRKVKFSASGLDDQTVAVPDGTAVSTGDAIQVTRSASKVLQPDWQFVRVVRTRAALGSVQDADRHVSTPIGFQVQSAGVYAPTPGGNSKSWVQLTWTQNPAHEGVAHYIVAYQVDGESVWHELIDDVPPLQIRDLEVSTTYNFRIRAVNGHGVMSAWSSVISYVTGADETVPLAVSGLTWNFDGINCVLDWSDNTEDDFSHYQIQIWDSSGENTKYRDITRRASSYTYTYDDNQEDGGGTADPVLWIKVRAVDYTGNAGTWATATATNTAPSAITGLATDWVNNDLVLTWTGPTVFSVPDLVYYRIRIYTSLGGTLLRDVGETNHLGYLYTADMNRADNLAAVTGVDIDTSLYIIVNAVDAFNQNSTNVTASPSKGTPGAISNLVANFSGSSLKLDWDDVADPSNLDYYKVVITHDAGTTTFEVRNSYFEYTYNQNARDNGYPPDPSLSYAVSWVNKHGQESTASSGSASNTTPSIPTGLSATGGFEQIVVTWAANSEDDLLGYKLYGSQTAAWSYPGPWSLLWEGLGREFSHAVGYQETWYYRVSAVDLFGQESDKATAVSATSHDIDTNTPGVPTSFALTSDIEEVYMGDFRGVIYATWVAPAGEPAAFQYELRWKISTEGVYEYKKTATGVTNDSIHNLVPEKTYHVNIRSLSRYGTPSAWYNSGVDTQETIANDTTAPNVSTVGLTAAAGTMKITLEWTAPSESDTFRILVYRNTVNNSGTAVLVAVVAADPGSSQQYVDQFDDGSSTFVPGTTYYYWIKATDRAGNISVFSAVASSAVSGVDDTIVTVTGQAVVTSRQLDLELMRQSFNILSWAQFAIFEAFDDETKRASPDPATYDARVYYGTLDNGEDNTASRAFGFNSKTYTDITTVHTGTSTGVGLNYLEDTNSSWFDGQYKNYVLVDSALTEFTISDSVDSTDRLIVSGTPAAGAYSIKAQNPSYAVAFCTYKDSTSGGGTGTTKLEASFNGGTNWQTFLDTSIPTNVLEGLVSIANTGNDYRFRVTVTNDGSGNGAIVYKVLVCTDPSVWQ